MIGTIECKAFLREKSTIAAVCASLTDDATNTLKGRLQVMADELILNGSNFFIGPADIEKYGAKHLG